MPELPEVEVTRQSFATRISGARIVAVQMGKPLRWPLGCEPQRLHGATITQVTRRGKYLILQLQDAAGVLLLHLGMSGSLLFAEQLPARGVHDHADIVTSQGTLRLNDPRRFGAVVWSPDVGEGAAAKLLGTLGPEPLEPGFDPLAFHAFLQGRRISIKQVLLEGKAVVGVGNIYACEALFMARISPVRAAATLSVNEARRLHAAIRDVLVRAMNSGGSTLRNFSSAAGRAGHFQNEVFVYGRRAKPCRMCSTPIAHMQQAQRSTFFCPACQH